MPNLVSRMIATLQVGLVLTLLGAGLITLRGSVGDAGTTLLVLGVVAFMPGLGLIMSAGILWLLGKRLNLVETQHVQPDMDLRGRE
jgi:predicted phage tail protein